MKRTLTRADLLNIGSLITYKEGDTEHCLGDLMYFKEHGCYDPYFGKVDLTEDEANVHNRCLDEAKLKGMDDNCQIGQGSYAYYVNGVVKTFIGTVISKAIELSPKRITITFYRFGKVYRGKLSKEADCFNFRRVK